jgi:hypothetical protein
MAASVCGISPTKSILKLLEKIERVIRYTTLASLLWLLDLLYSIIYMMK